MITLLIVGEVLKHRWDSPTYIDLEMILSMCNFDRLLDMVGLEQDGNVLEDTGLEVVVQQL